MDEPATPRTGGGHVVLCGLNELGYRTLEELARMGAEVVVVVRAAAADLAAGARALGATLVQGSYRDESVLRAAGVPTAAAMVVTEDDDVGNLHAALTAHDLNPALRIRLRMFNQELGRRVERAFGIDISRSPSPPAGRWWWSCPAVSSGRCWPGPRPVSGPTATPWRSRWRRWRRPARTGLVGPGEVQCACDGSPRSPRSPGSR